MERNKGYDIVTFYKFVNLKDLDILKERIANLCEKHSIKGTIIIASEGVNATVAGGSSEMELFCSAFSALCQGFCNIKYRATSCDFIPFAKTKVRIKKEIVRLKQKDLEVMKQSQSGHYLGSSEWDELLNQEDLLLIDARNHYEISFGSFFNAIDPLTENFSELVSWLQKSLHGKKREQKIAMFCTGGIRCEKATAYVKSLGFDNVYHLEGGVLKYLNDKRSKVLSEDLGNSQDKDFVDKWHGQLFVFDDRVALSKDLKPLVKKSIAVE